MNEQRALEILKANRSATHISVVGLLVFDWMIGADEATLDGYWNKEELEAASWLMNNLKP